MELTNKTILIAGASSGIGRAIAREVGGANNRVVICARRKTELDRLALEIEALGSRALAVPIDALDKDAASAAVSSAVEAFGSIDVALLNIGDGPSFHMARATVDEITGNMDVNYRTLVNFLVPIIAQMKDQGHGLITHTNSLAGFLGLPMQGPYSAAKAAGRILMDTCRVELEPFGIKCVSVYPGFVATERVAEDGIPAPFEISESMAAIEIIKAIEKEKPDHLFPFVTASLVRLARVLPKAMTQRILARSVPDEY